MRNVRRSPGFTPGTIVATPNALEQVPLNEIHPALLRHLCGDWGEVDEEDWHANDRALLTEGRVLSAYRSAAGVQFWIITEADRSVTTVLLPEDY
jgi:hypothetical protein